MTTTIAGHKLTTSEREALDAVLDYLRRYSGDSHAGPNTSPKGDGRAIALLEIFPDEGARRKAQFALDGLAKVGVLRACEVGLGMGCVLFAPLNIGRATKPSDWSENAVPALHDAIMSISPEPEALRDFCVDLIGYLDVLDRRVRQLETLDTERAVVPRHLVKGDYE